MYSIDFNPEIIKGLDLVDVDLIFPHEKIIEKNTSTISNFLKSFNDHIVLSSILCCSKSMVIIDGHHRYFSLKKLGFKKIPVTKLDYFSDDIKTSIDQKYSKDQIIEHGIS
jgi:ParB-like chromosome segregation protein Spo0J